MNELPFVALLTALEYSFLSATASLSWSSIGDTLVAVQHQQTVTVISFHLRIESTTQATTQDTDKRRLLKVDQWEHDLAGAIMLFRQIL